MFRTGGVDGRVFCRQGQSPLVWKFCPKAKRMKIHEYQAKDILERYGVAVPKGEVANTLEEAMDVAKRLFAGGAKGVVVKAQIHAGGRGKGGGVKVAKTLADAEEYTKKILGMQLITHQTGPEGQKVQRVLIEEMSPIERELYLGIVLDRAAAKLVFMASQAGGMEIERGRGQRSRRDLQGLYRPCSRLSALPSPQTSLRAGPQAHPDQRRGQVHDRPLQSLSGDGRFPAGD